MTQCEADLIERIHYSDRYSDDEYEYRHVILPKGLLKLAPTEVSSRCAPHLGLPFFSLSDFDYSGDVRTVLYGSE